VHLYTSDGSVDCQHDPNEQEAIVAQLHFCEAVAGMGCLAADGSMVLKMFTYFESSTLALLALLGPHFEEVSPVSPQSRPSLWPGLLARPPPSGLALQACLLPCFQRRDLCRLQRSAVQSRRLWPPRRLLTLLAAWVGFLGIAQDLLEKLLVYVHSKPILAPPVRDVASGG